MNKLKSFILKLLLSLEIYVVLLLFAVLVYQILGLVESGKLMDQGETFGVVMMVGIGGGLCIMGGCDFFLFPYAPALIISAILFLAIHFLGKLNFFITHKRKIILSITAVLIIIFTANTVLWVVKYKSDEARWKKADEERAVYTEKYGTTEKIDSDQDFIRIDQKIIFDESRSIYSAVVSKVDGSQKQELDVLLGVGDDNDIRPHFISPRGNYYIRLRKSGYEGSEIVRINGESLLDLNTLNGGRDLSVSYDDNLKWANNEKYIARLEGDGLVFYDIVKQKMYKIATVFLKDDLYSQEASFDWSFDAKSVYFSDDTGLHVVTNIDEIADSGGMAMPNEITLSNLNTCGNIEYSYGKIYCSVKAADLGIVIKDQENINVEYQDYFIISQEVNQKSKRDYQVISEAPVPEVERIHPVDQKYIVVEPSLGERILINSETKKQRKIDEIGDELERDKDNIFSEPKDKGIQPIPYVGG